jgi:hypothetical protein
MALRWNFGKDCRKKAKAQRQAQYTEANKEAKKSATMDKRNFIEGQAQEAEDASGKGDMKETLQEAKHLPPSGPSCSKGG